MLLQISQANIWGKFGGVLLENRTTIGFQRDNGPYTYTVSGGNGRVFLAKLDSYMVAILK